VIVAARVRKTRDDPHADRVADAQHDNRDLARGVLRGQHGRRKYCDDNIDLQANQLSGQFRQALEIAFGGTDFEADSLPLDITEIPQLLPERGKLIIRDDEHADRGHLRLLREQGMWRCNSRAAEQDYKVAPPHQPFAVSTLGSR